MYDEAADEEIELTVGSSQFAGLSRTLVASSAATYSGKTINYNSFSILMNRNR